MLCEQISYRVIRSRRRSVAVQITPQGEVVVRSPLRMSDAQIKSFVSSKAALIQSHLSALADTEKLPSLTAEEIGRLTNLAARWIPERAAFFAQKIGVSYGRITVRHQRTLWGSCSGKGNLNFNCLLMLVPETVLDYVVVHELCHRKQMNHSPEFWAEVEKILPDYRERKAWLKKNGSALIGRLGPG